MSNLPSGGAALSLARHLHASKDLQALVSVSTIGPVDVRSACDGLEAVVPQCFSESLGWALGAHVLAARASCCCAHMCWESGRPAGNHSSLFDVSVS